MILSKALPFAFCPLLAIAVLGIKQQSATEAHAALDTAPLGQNPGSPSISNGIPEPSGDTYALDQQRFERRNGVDDGLGPAFNATSCSDRHEAIDDNTLLGIAASQSQSTKGRIHGEAVQVALFEAPGQTRVGRFGWKVHKLVQTGSENSLFWLIVNDLPARCLEPF